MGDTKNGEPKSVIELLDQLKQQHVDSSKHYQAVRSFLDFRAREKGVPLSGSFELTPLCNLDCKMCYVHLSHEQMREKSLLRVDTWESIMEAAIREGMMYARLTGGECLTYPGFRRLYEFLRKFGVEVTILTNGILMDEEMVLYLKENPPARIQMTLYGASEEAYERVTGYRQFLRVRDNILRMQEAGLPIDIVLTPNRFMTDGEEIVRLCKELGLRPSINSGLIMPRAETKRTMLNAELEKTVAMLRLRQELFDDKNVQWDREDLPVIEEGNSAEDIPVYGVLCGAGRSGFHIAWDGCMEPCSGFPGIREDVLYWGFKEAWERVHRQIGEFPYPQECRDCEDKHICQLCVTESAAGAPIGHASAYICERTRRMKKEGWI